MCSVCVVCVCLCSVCVRARVPPSYLYLSIQLFNHFYGCCFRFCALFAFCCCCLFVVVGGGEVEGGHILDLLGGRWRGGIF